MTSQLLEFLRTHEEAFRSRARLASLYSDFRYQRSTNPDGYQANSSAWLGALSSAATSGLIPSSSGTASDRFVLSTGDDLLRELQTQEYGRPLALSAVVEDAVKGKELIPLKDFMERRDNVYHKKWVPSPWEIVTWGLRQVGMMSDASTGGENGLVSGQFVLLGNVEAAAKALLDKATQITTSNTSRIFSKDLFNSSFASAIGVESLSRNDLDVLLKHLERDRAAIAYSAASGVVKFKAAGEAEPALVTEEDISIASLRALISSIEPQIGQLTARIAQLDITARTAVSKKQLAAAKTTLRQKRLADTRLQQRSATLAQLEDVYAKIEQAADQVEIVKVMEASSQVLTRLNKQTGGVEKVNDVMDGLREEMMNVDEIGQAINEISAGEIDESEVDDELQALEEAEKQKQEAVERTERDKKEDAEKSVLEKRETEEAEKTRQRLAELDKVSGLETEQNVEGATGDFQEAEKAAA